MKVHSTCATWGATWGLNLCPDAAWSAERPTALAARLEDTEVTRNGPR